jgi:hypothetical protein
MEKVESVISRMRWKAHFFINGTNSCEQYYYGLRSRNPPPPIKEMKNFEDDVVRMIENIRFRKVNDQFLSKLDNDLRKIKKSPNVIIFADKTRNVYESSPENHDKILKDNITKTYKIGDESITDDINCELKGIAEDLGICNKIDIMAKCKAFVTVKDHKENFEQNPKYRLINPAKSELGKVSKVILDDINDKIRAKIGVNQWKNSQSVIEWFMCIENKERHSFLSFDIAEFYPSITKDLLDKAIDWAKNITHIPDQHKTIIYHARNSLLFNNKTPWVKRNNQSLFDVTMGSYDGAEICELVGLFILNELSKSLGKDRVGLYRDDGLVLLRGTSGRIADQTRKLLHRIFDEQFGLKITAEVNHQSVNFLDFTLDLSDGSYRPYRKPNNDPIYVNSHSNHPPSIIRQLPESINKRISQLSSDELSFNLSAPVYEAALQRSNYHTTLKYNSSTNSNTTSRNRPRNIIWFNPPYSRSVASKVGKHFLHLLDKHFPRSNTLHKIFNRNTVKVSYSCMSNVKTVISNHNAKVLSKQTERPTTEQREKTCNCRESNDCPLEGNCLARSIVYEARVTTEDDGKVMNYIGMTANDFKERYRNHQKSFRDVIYSNETELSKYIWTLKHSGRSFRTSWAILKRAKPYAAGGNRCNLCNYEKLSIMNANKRTLLNKRNEIFSKCRHVRKFLAGNFKRARVSTNVARAKSRAHARVNKQTPTVNPV